MKIECNAYLSHQHLKECADMFIHICFAFHHGQESRHSIWFVIWYLVTNFCCHVINQDCICFVNGWNEATVFMEVLPVGGARVLVDGDKPSWLCFLLPNPSPETELQKLRLEMSWPHVWYLDAQFSLCFSIF